MKTISKTVGQLHWSGDKLESGESAVQQALERFEESVVLVDDDQGQLAVTQGGGLNSEGQGRCVRAWVPALTPAQLGDSDFCAAHGLNYAYVAGAMANGIASEEIVEAMAGAGMLGIFGAAGLPLPRVQKALDRLTKNLKGKPFGSNLIHSPNEPALENGCVDLYLKYGVERVSASAYLALTLPLLRYRFHGIHRDQAGEVVVPNQVIAKVSRVEVAQKFFSPPPDKMLAELVNQGHLTAEQAEMAASVPVAEDLTAEADSGGHTDNRPALALIPTMVSLRDELQRKYGYKTTLRVGAAGGIATPASANAAFSMGAAYLVTGSVNQACVESGSSDVVRSMLAKASQADVAMAPAADMFEMGVQLQVLKWGTMFPVRARKLYELYRNHKSLGELPAPERAILERDYFRCTLEEEWSNTRKFFEERDPRQIARAESDPKHKMALVFRSYLGRSSLWANQGLPDRKVDYQIWCGPAMGAFNQWVKGSFLEGQDQRQVVTVGQNLLAGAAYLQRLNWARNQGVRLGATVGDFRPRPQSELKQYFGG